MTSRLLLYCLGLICALAHAVGDEPEIIPVLDEKSEAAITRFSDFYKKVKSFSVKCHSQLAGSITIRSDTNVVCEKPNKLAMDRDTDELGKEVYRCDGQITGYYNPGDNSYLRSALKEPDQIKVSAAEFGFFGLDAFIVEDPRASMLEEVRSVKWIEIDQIDGMECDHLQLVQTTGTVDVWIATGIQPLLLRMSVRLQDLDYELQLEEWKLNPEITENTFRFIPPAGAVEATR